MRAQAQGPRVRTLGQRSSPQFAPTRAQSVRIMNADTPVFLAARERAPRRGTIARGTRLPILGRVRAAGCSTGVWVQVGPSLYLCDRHVEYSREAPFAEAHPIVPPGQRLPYDYAFVAVDGARAFAHPQDYFTDEYYDALGAGFGVVLRGQETYDGIRFARTRRGLFIPQRELRMARGSDFQGLQLAPGQRIGWVRPRQAAVRARRGGRSVRSLSRRTVVHVDAVDRGWVRLEDGGWMRVRDLHLMELQEPPEAVQGEGTWLDLSVSSQVLVAYRGPVPVFATLVSSGRRGRHHATPLGDHRMWVKLAFSDMDNLQREDLRRNYAIERVPWVQYFAGANGLHAAFWHDDFGRRKSHGCINLAPVDARSIFEFTEPALPIGWTAIFPREDEPTTYVRVRE